MKTSDVEFGFLAHPAAGAHPGVVMIHDVWGLSDHTRDLARRLAGDGFSVLAVDLYRREEKVSIQDPAAWMRELSDPQLLADVQAGADFLADHAAVAERRVGITGFCMGGQYALLSACSVRGLSACVCFYGMLSYDHGLLAPPRGGRFDPTKKPRSPLDAVADLSCPLLGLFGEEDAFIPLSDVRELEIRAAKTGKPCEIVRYPGAGHAFMNDTRPDAYRPAVARDAWGRLLSFFRLHLAA